MISGKVRRDHHTGALLRAMLLAVVLALFAMHVLASHQPAHSGHAAAFPLIDAGDKTLHAHSDVASGDATRTPDSLDGESPCDHGGVGESCLALLCIVAALFTFALRRGGSNRILGRRAEPTHSWISRTGDPPCLHRLSILRC
ncbi:hypothetical protein J7E96_31390 [Streptomyces sp. ISL-96]|uniref:DUF6153 family protein n=1 Tax=Streptomyces sp. ISL-96 TaxID=2819191 RepID=UPI001BE8744E|nr:DUF6153 family protein [Streptomyces sp. ISL-96]MBT2492932.1 hypothetical protein [Streptomyces sp. ISL-96]